MTVSESWKHVAGNLKRASEVSFFKADFSKLLVILSRSFNDFPAIEAKILLRMANIKFFIKVFSYRVLKAILLGTKTPYF